MPELPWIDPELLGVPAHDGGEGSSRSGLVQHGSVEREGAGKVLPGYAVVRPAPSRATAVKTDPGSRSAHALRQIQHLVEGAGAGKGLGSIGKHESRCSPAIWDLLLQAGLDEAVLQQLVAAKKK